MSDDLQAVVISTAAAPAPETEAGFSALWQQFAESKGALLALFVCVVLLAAALLAPWIAPQNPYDLTVIDITDSRLPPGSANEAGFKYWLGTDGQGRDMLSAMLYGLRLSLFVGVLS